MADKDRKEDFRSRKLELGLEARNVYLDALTRKHLAILVNASELKGRGPSATSAVISEALNSMHRGFKKKRPVKARKHWLAQNVRIASNTIAYFP
jgi:hypothetical protein